MIVFVGYDKREDEAYRVCKASLEKYGNEVIPLVQQNLRELGWYDRPTDNAATEFSLTRFLTPYFAKKIHADQFVVFVDCDFLFTVDIKEVLKEIDPTKAVSVVKHDYTPKSATKMDGQKQEAYPRKNWSSFIVFNRHHPKVLDLTPEVVNMATPAYLHRFSWLDDEDIGELDKDWNYLVGEYPSDHTPKALHYTLGGPWFEETKNCDFADLWIQESLIKE